MKSRSSWLVEILFVVGASVPLVVGCSSPSAPQGSPEEAPGSPQLSQGPQGGDASTSNPSSSCSPGQTRACATSPGGPQDGTETCQRSGEFGSWGACTAANGPSADGGGRPAPDGGSCSNPTCVYEVAIDHDGDELKSLQEQGTVPACVRCCQTNCHQSCSGSCGHNGVDETQGDCYKNTYLGGGSGKSAFVDQSCKVLSTGTPPPCTKVCGKADVNLN